MAYHVDSSRTLQDRTRQLHHTPMGFPVYSAASGPAAISYVVYEVRLAVSSIKVDRLTSS